MKKRIVLAASLMTLAAAIGAAIESVPNFERIVRAISFKGIGDDAKGSERGLGFCLLLVSGQN